MKEKKTHTKKNDNNEYVRTEKQQDKKGTFISPVSISPDSTFLSPDSMTQNTVTTTPTARKGLASGLESLAESG